MTASSPPDDATLTDLEDELARTSSWLHHSERDHLEYGVPVDRDTPVWRDPSGRTLTDLADTCAHLRSRLQDLKSAAPTQ